jgi:hypothetical protein
VTRTLTPAYPHIAEGDPLWFVGTGTTTPRTVKVLPRGRYSQLMVQFVGDDAPLGVLAVGDNELFRETF